MLLLLIEFIANNFALNSPVFSLEKVQRTEYYISAVADGASGKRTFCENYLAFGFSIKQVAFINVIAFTVFHSSKLADGGRDYLVGDVSIQHTFLLSILNNVCVTILLIEESTSPFSIVKAFSPELDILS